MKETDSELDIMQPLIARAKELLTTAKHAALATVNEDGSPHNTPHYLMFDDTLEHFYWGSHPESLHSRNIARTGQGFLVIYDMLVRGGLFVKLENGHATQGEELKTALAVHNKMRAREGKKPLDISYYQQDEQSMYKADAVKFWVNKAERDGTGMVIRDYRYKVKREDLL